MGGDFYAQRALPRSGQTISRRKRAANALVQPQSFQSCRRQNNRVVIAVIQLAKARLHIAAQGANLQMWETGTQLGFAAQAGCANNRAMR